MGRCRAPINYGWLFFLGFSVGFDLLAGFFLCLLSGLLRFLLLFLLFLGFGFGCLPGFLFCFSVDFCFRASFVLGLCFGFRLGFSQLARFLVGLCLRIFLLLGLDFLGFLLCPRLRFGLRAGFFLGSLFGFGFRLGQSTRFLACLA